MACSPSGGEPSRLPASSATIPGTTHGGMPADGAGVHLGLDRAAARGPASSDGGGQFVPRAAATRHATERDAGLDPCPTTFITTFLPIDLSSLIHIALTADLRLSISTDIHTFMATRILDAQRRARGSRSPFTYRHPYRHAYRKGLSKSTSGAWSTPRGVNHHPYLIPYNSRSAPYGNPQGRGRGQSRKVSPRSAAADLKTPPRRSTRHQ